MKRPVTENEREYMLNHMSDCMFWPEYENKGVFDGITKALLVLPAIISLIMVGIWFLIDGFGIFGMDVGAIVLMIFILIPACLSPFLYMEVRTFLLEKYGFNKQLKKIIMSADTIMEIKIKAVVTPPAEIYFDTDEGESLIVYSGSRNTIAPHVGDKLFIVTGTGGSLVIKKFTCE